MTKNPNVGVKSFFVFFFLFFFFCFFLGGGGDEGVGGMGEEEYAGKVVDIKRMTKNPNPGFSNFAFLWGEGEGGCAGQEEV